MSVFPDQSASYMFHGLCADFPEYLGSRRPQWSFLRGYWGFSLTEVLSQKHPGETWKYDIACVRFGAFLMKPRCTHCAVVCLCLADWGLTVHTSQSKVHTSQSKLNYVTFKILGGSLSSVPHRFCIIQLSGSDSNEFCMKTIINHARLFLWSVLRVLTMVY
jgi:hypothetical protein